jgi:hypothetical protein
VLDQTPPAHPVAGQRVRLELVEHGSASTRGTATDLRGRFRFSHLPIGASRVFLVQVQYAGVPYTARAVPDFCRPSARRATARIRAH